MEIKEFQITDVAIHRASGYGKYRITVEVLHNDIYKEINFYSTNSQLFDNKDEDDNKEMLILSLGGEEAIYNTLND